MLEMLTLETSLLIANKFKWFDINFTLRGLLHHSLELIEANGGWSIGVPSEKALESNTSLSVDILKGSQGKHCLYNNLQIQCLSSLN